MDYSSTTKTAILAFSSESDLNAKILSLQAKAIIAILPYKQVKTDMGDSMILTSVIVIYT